MMRLFYSGRLWYKNPFGRSRKPPAGCRKLSEFPEKPLRGCDKLSGVPEKSLQGCNSFSGKKYN
ncbi:hypothetical protein [uncultured Chryseobacterium sp.]|uniref:hypothetical protein n=1 Tax=uncultured Chryseobacterium sp. TaxID=259322 RepID=UPI0025881556|nr:hypothetical protein [uncultured Chryseobacterium sp.]